MSKQPLPVTQKQPGWTGFDRATLGRIYSVVGVFLGLYAVTVYLIAQGGIGSLVGPGLDANAKITSAYNSIWIIGFGLLGVALSGAAFARKPRASNELPLPLPGLNLLQNVSAMRAIDVRFYMWGAFLFCVILPAAVLWHVNKKVMNEGWLWNDKLAADSVMEARCAHPIWPFGTCTSDNRKRVREVLGYAGDHTLWLTNHKCDALYEKENGKPSDEARRRVGTDCLPGQRDRSELCRTDTWRCRGSQWLQVSGVPLIVVPSILGWASVVLLVVALAIGPRQSKSDNEFHK